MVKKWVDRNNEKALPQGFLRHHFMEGGILAGRIHNVNYRLRYDAGDPWPDLRSIPHVQPQWHQVQNSR